MMLSFVWSDREMRMLAGSRYAWLRALADPAGPAEVLPAKRLTLRGLGALCDLADRHGVLPSVLANLRQAIARHGAGCVVETKEKDPPGEGAATLARAEERLVKRTALSMLLRRQAGEVAAALQAESLQAIVLKGADFADRLYPRPALRPFSDVDLLIPERAVPDVERVMARLGYEPSLAGMKYASGYGERGWRRPGQAGGTVEIHWDLVNSPSLRKAVSVRYEDLQLVEPVAACGLCRASPAAMLLIAAVHGATSHGFDRLQILYDVAQIVRGAAGPVDADWLAGAAKRTGAALAVSVALSLGEKVLGEPRCAELGGRLRLPVSTWLCRAMLTRGTVLRARAPIDGLRRQAFREILKWS